MQASHSASPSYSLFDKYGGMRALRSVIMSFYDRVLDSDVVGHFFEDIDLARLVDHQLKFFTMVLGGPASFTDSRLLRAHIHLGVTNTQFDEVIQLLRETLEEAGFNHEDLQITISAVENRRTLIVS